MTAEPVAKKGHNGKRAKVHEQIRTEVECDGTDGVAGTGRIDAHQRHRRRHRHHQVSGMGDGRVGQESLHVGLSVGREVAECAGDSGHQANDIHHEVPRQLQPGKTGFREVCLRHGVDPRGRHAEAEADPQQERHGRSLARDRQEAADLGCRPFKHVGAPEVKGHRRQLERQSNRDH